jgi:hypothetical protein
MLTRHSFPRHAQRVTNSQSHSPIWIAIGIDERTHENVWSCCEIFIKLQVGFSPQRAKFSKISCVDTAPGEPPGLPFGTPVGPRSSRGRAGSDERQPRSGGRREIQFVFDFRFSTSSDASRELFSARMRILLREGLDSSRGRRRS